MKPAKSILLVCALAVPLAFFTGCNRDRTAQYGPGAGTEATEADRLATSPGVQTFTGVLLDANCAEIRDMGAAHSSPAATPDIPAASPGTLTAVAELPEKFRNCRVTTNTNDFAVYANGQVYRMDEDSNNRIREQLRSEGHLERGAEITVTVTGSIHDDRLKVEAVQFIGQGALTP